MSALAIAAADPVSLSLDIITRDPAVNCRASGVSEETATEYAEAIKAGAKFPPVIVFKDESGTWLGDGWHRCRAHELAGKTEIDVEIREGGRREALLYAAKANASHGNRRSRADVRRAIGLVLAECGGKSDRWIATECGCNHETVSARRKELADSASSTERLGKDGKKRRLPRMPGKGRRPKTPPAELARRVPRMLDKLTRRWPKGEPLAAFLDAVRKWLESRSTDGQPGTMKPEAQQATRKRARSNANNPAEVNNG